MSVLHGQSFTSVQFLFDIWEKYYGFRIVSAICKFSDQKIFFPLPTSEVSIAIEMWEKQRAQNLHCRMIFSCHGRTETIYCWTCFPKSANCLTRKNHTQHPYFSKSSEIETTRQEYIKHIHLIENIYTVIVTQKIEGINKGKVHK